MSTSRRDHLILLKPRSPLAQDVTAFLVDRQARGLSPRTVDFYRDELRYLQKWAQTLGVTETLALTPDLVRRYLLDLGCARNPGGIHAAYRALRAFLRWYEREYEPQDWQNPIAKVRPPKLPQEPLSPVSLRDLRAMLQTCKRKTFTGDRDRAMLLALLDTGCRASEFLALNVGDVNLSTGAVLVWKAKGSKARTVFLGAKARRELVRYLRYRPDAEATDPLWVTTQGTRLTYAGLRQVVRRRAEWAGVDMPSLHSFRRAFALLSLRSGCDVYSLQAMMGHRDLSVLRRYLAQTEEDLQRAHERSGPVDNLL